MARLFVVGQLEQPPQLHLGHVIFRDCWWVPQQSHHTADGGEIQRRDHMVIFSVIHRDSTVNCASMWNHMLQILQQFDHGCKNCWYLHGPNIVTTKWHCQMSGSPMWKSKDWDKLTWHRVSLYSEPPQGSTHTNFKWKHELRPQLNSSPQSSLFRCVRKTIPQCHYTGTLMAT